MATTEPLTQEIATHYDRYRRWFERSLDYIWRLPPALRQTADPMKRMREIEATAPKMAVKSLSQGISDTVGLTSRYSREDVAAVDALFRNEDLPTLSSLRMMYGRKLRKLLKQTHIMNEEDYYYLKGFETSEMPESMREKIQYLLGTFEVDAGG